MVTLISPCINHLKVFKLLFELSNLLLFLAPWSLPPKTALNRK